MNFLKRTGFYVKKVIIFSLPFFLFIIPILITMNSKELQIFPDDQDFYFGTYTDSDEDGNSIAILSRMKKKELVFYYKLGDKIQYPYAGMYICSFYDNEFIDVSSYDLIKIKIKSEKSRAISLQLNFFAEGFTTEDIYNTSFVLSREIPLWQNEEEYIFAFKEFVSPDWWLNRNKLIREEAPVPDFSRMMLFEIENIQFFEKNLLDKIIISDITFLKDNKIFFLICSVIISIYYFILLLLFIIKKYNKKISDRIQKVIIPYKYLELESHIDKESRKIISCIGENYFNSKLDVISVSNYCNISSGRIPVVIKKRFNLTFPQYLNSIRVLVAKRLLKSTDFSVLKIAMDIGYNDVSHFNRIFKRYEKKSPIQFRKTQKKVESEKNKEIYL